MAVPKLKEPNSFNGGGQGIVKDDNFCNCRNVLQQSVMQRLWP